MILVTGNKGYIGMVMTKLLKERFYSVIGLDSDWFKGCNLYDSHLFYPDRQIKKDIRNITEEDLKDIDCVFHLAGLSNDPLGELNPELTDQINCQATIRLAHLCKKLKIKRFIFASTCSVYGIASDSHFLTEEDFVEPLTAYAKAKANAEIQLKNLADEHFHPVILRNATVYGDSPQLRLDLVVNQLVANAYLTGEIIVMSDGTPWRPLIHIEDFCRAFMAVLEAPLDKIHNQVFNAGGNDANYTIRDIAYEVNKVIPQARVCILNHLSSGTGGRKDERSYRVDFSKMKRDLCFIPQKTLPEGIESLLQTYKNYGLTKKDFESSKYFRMKTIQSLLQYNHIGQDLFWLYD